MLTVFLLSSRDSFCQTTKVDVYALKESRLISSKEPVGAVGLQVAEQAKPHNLLAKMDPGSSAKSAVLGKQPSVESHTQNLSSTTQILRANTHALNANTQALKANTAAMEANVQAAQANMRLRDIQMQNATAPVPVKNETPAKPDLSGESVVINRPAATVAPAPAVIKPQVVATHTPVKAPVKPQPSHEMVPAPVIKPVAVKVQEAPKPKAPSKPSGIIGTASAAPIKHTTPLLATAPVMAPAKIIPAAAPAKIVPPARVEKKMNVASAIPAAPAIKMTKPVAAAAVKPAIVPAAKAPVSPVKSNVGMKANTVAKSNKTVKLDDLLQLPLLDRAFDNKHDLNNIPMAAKAGLKEGDIVTTQGYLHLVATEDSGKVTEAYYLQLTVHGQWGDSCLIVKVPSKQMSTMTSSEANMDLKKFLRQQLTKGKTPCVGGNIMHNSVYVSVTGSLAYNSLYAGAMRGPKPLYRGRRNMHSYTPWEIKNVSRLEFILP
jgi:hypothetical protein